VRIEIATALKRDIPVIPILLEGTRVPKFEQLPDDLKELALRNGLEVRHASFHADMDKLVRALHGAATPTSPAPTADDATVPKPEVRANLQNSVSDMGGAGSSNLRRDTGNNQQAEFDLSGIWSGGVSYKADSYNYEWFMAQEGRHVSGTIALSNKDGGRRSAYFFVGDIRENKLYFRGTKWFSPPEVEWCIASGELNIPAPGSSYNELRGTWGPGPVDVEQPCPSGGGEIYLRRKEPL
jgi:hypothetical protein